MQTLPDVAQSEAILLVQKERRARVCVSECRETHAKKSIVHTLNGGGGISELSE